MKYRKVRSNLLAITIFVVAFGYSQGEYIEVQDFVTWSGVNLKYKLDDKWTTSVKAQLRLDANSSEVSQYFGQMGVFYRYEQELNEQFPKTRNIIGLKYTYTLKK